MSPCGRCCCPGPPQHLRAVPGRPRAGVRTVVPAARADRVAKRSAVLAVGHDHPVMADRAGRRS
eukprot:8324654-Lingulodinium_polyedra.AAC.1